MRPMPELQIVELPTSELVEYSRNSKLHPHEQIDQIANSISEFGNNDPIAVWHNENGEPEIVEGHGRLMALRKLGIETAPVIYLDHLSDEQRRAYALVHNKLTMNSDFDFEILAEELATLDSFDMGDFGFDFELQDVDAFEQNEQSSSLAERFIVPPFSVLDTRQGYWRDRKQWWNDKIGDIGQARGGVKYITSWVAGTKMGVPSVLDPVLSELSVKWFMPCSGKCFDVFAGDTVFGYVSSFMGNEFIGIELRDEQCRFNREVTAGMSAKYVCDDGRNVCRHIKEGSQDLLFSCPPYYDIEVYSDLDNDASNQPTYEQFYAILDEAFKESVKCLKNNRFAVVVVGDVRNRATGEYYDFPGDVKKTFREAGMCLYNELVLIEPVGSARLRAERFMHMRKVAKTHQNVLVFYKGDPTKVAEHFPVIEVEYASDDMEP